MKRHSALVILVLAALLLVGACNGGNEVTGLGDGRQLIPPETPVTTPPVTPSPGTTPGPNPTPNPCVRHPEVCE